MIKDLVEFLFILFENQQYLI